jgi:hypothetical protein
VDGAQKTIWTGTQWDFSPENLVTDEVAAITIAKRTPKERTTMPIPIAWALSDRITHTRE